MPEYEQSLSVAAAPEIVFAYVSDVGNLPNYLPTVTHAEAQSDEHVRVQGSAGGRDYDSDGYFRINETEHRMEWGSDGENQYSGWLEVDGVNDMSEVTVHLSFQPKPSQTARLEEQSGSRDQAILDGLSAALNSIRNEVEGKGGKVESNAATAK